MTLKSGDLVSLVSVINQHQHVIVAIDKSPEEIQKYYPIGTSVIFISYVDSKDNYFDNRFGKRCNILVNNVFGWVWEKEIEKLQ